MCIRDRRKEDDIDCKHSFYKRIANYTDIRLSKDEENLLSKGIKYNLPNFSKNVLLQEVTNAEAIIKCIRNQDSQCEIRSVSNNKLNRLLTTDIKNNARYKKDFNIAKNIKQKVDRYKAKLTKADKGNTVVCLLYTSRCV